MKATERERLKYHCVEVIAGDNACDSAKSLKGIRLLSADAPLLPLKTCEAADCKCIYRHFDDRRQGPRREQHMRISTPYVSLDRRKRRGRRVTDYD
jgi:hypothetical protein